MCACPQFPHMLCTSMLSLVAHHAHNMPTRRHHTLYITFGHQTQHTIQTPSLTPSRTHTHAHTRTGYGGLGPGDAGARGEREARQRKAHKHHQHYLQVLFGGSGEEAVWLVSGVNVCRVWGGKTVGQSCNMTGRWRGVLRSGRSLMVESLLSEMSPQVCQNTP